MNEMEKATLAVECIDSVVRFISAATGGSERQGIEDVILHLQWRLDTWEDEDDQE